MSCHDHDTAKPPGKRSGSLAIVAAGDETPAVAAGRKYWRSVEERSGSPDILKAAQREFPPGASELDGVSRRSFVQLLSASAALAGGVACQRPNHKIVPFVRRPPEVTPGNPLHFATAYSLEGFGSGLVVESHSGRPTKIEGNPDHPDTAGATNSIEQALILNLYDHNRARQIRHKGEPAAWKSLLAELATRSQTLAADGGAKLRFLVEPSASPLLADLRARILLRYPKAKFVSYSSVAAEGQSEGARLAFGRPLEVRNDLSQAAVIVSLDADFLVDGPEQIRLARQFAAARTPGANMNRLYVAEPCLTVTGGMADHRLRVRGSEITGLAQALVAELSKLPGAESLAPLAALPKSPAGPDAKWVAAVAKDLARARGKGLLIAGRRQPAAVHALVNAVNVALGNVGTTVTYWAPVLHDTSNGIESLRGLVEDIAAGSVETLIITASNPVYTAPADFKLDKLLARIPNTLYWGLYEDETAQVVTTFIPAAHPLESWGDVRGLGGRASLVQPLISPLWSGLTDADVLASLLGEGDLGSHQLVKEFWRKRAVSSGWNVGASFDGLWESWLAKGVIDKTAEMPDTSVATNPALLAGTLQPLLAQAPKGEGLELAFTVDQKVFDGRFGNNTWLQELPHPITKITWDNAILISKTTATRLGLETGDFARIEMAGGAQVTGPVYMQPGHADDTITVALGYGRSGSEEFARDVGFNVGALRSSRAPWFDRGVTLTKTSGHKKFGITQDHWSMEGREPAMETHLAEFMKEGSEFHERVEGRRAPVATIHTPVDYSTQPYKWAMSIDLNKCTGCNACVVACQSENNIPVVGRDNVRIGREMQWIRLDRYYSGEIEDPEVIHQPVACVHCETAPCEYVCPVNATVHSDEGLNEMVYNRCIGTRYCSNNCPYKARRFNFLDYHEDVPSTRKMATNPDVTVRSRGIMEKCTYCVQRIERTRIDARVEGRKIRDGEILTACQQGCPSQAIVFGSLNDPGSQVSRQHQDARRYDLLGELGTRPRTIYLARVRNPNPDLA